MAYFSNGSEGMDYEEQYCSKCVHCDGCPVMDAHLLFAYELCNDKKNPGKIILDMLIPQNRHYAGECSMFFRAVE